jgi:hypothetical protein
MTASERILSLLSGVKPRGVNRWIFRCPAHDDKHPSCELCQIDDRALVICRAGCTAAEIMAAIGLQLSDLYDDTCACRPDPCVDFHYQAHAAIQVWRETEMMKAAVGLRQRDGAIRSTSDCVASGDLTTDDATEILAELYMGYSELEFRFETLRVGTTAEVLELWRQRGDIDEA